MNLVGKLNEFAPSRIFHLTPIPICCERYASFIGVQINLLCSAIQFTLLSNETFTSMQHAIYKHITWLFNNTEKTGLLKPSISDNAKRYDHGDRLELPLHLQL